MSPWPHATCRTCLFLSPLSFSSSLALVPSGDTLSYSVLWLPGPGPAAP